MSFVYSPNFAGELEEHEKNAKSFTKDSWRQGEFGGQID
jgi:hypothetical protein